MKFNAQISEEAAEWFVEFRSGEMDAAGRRDFDTWIRTSPEHLRAYLEIAAIWNEGDSLRAHRDLDSEGLIALARTEGNVVPLDVEASHQASNNRTAQPASQAPGKPRRASRRWVSALAGGLGMFILCSVVIVWWRLDREPVYVTSVGERRVLRLEDGSTVEINSRSRIRVRFSEDQRRVDLLEGQALFHVAKNAQRPFVVSSDDLRVRAIGTQFDVNRKPTGTTVTVVEGRVAVYRGEGEKEAVVASRESERNVRGAASHDGVPAPAPSAGGANDAHGGSAAILLSAGEQLTVADQSAPTQPRPASASAATAWTQGQLVLDSATLADVAEQFARYSTRRLIVDDRGVPPLRLSGVFATDPDFLLRYLRQRPDITIEETATEVRIIRHE